MLLLKAIITAFVFVAPFFDVEYCTKTGMENNSNVRLAAQISGNDLDFLALLDAENSQWTTDRVGVTKDIGLCQISPYYHPEVVKHPQFYEAEWQIRKCLEMYKGGVTFDGKENVHKTRRNFTCPI